MRRFTYAAAIIASLVILTTSCASNKATGLPAGPTEEPTTALCSGEVQLNDQLKFVPDTCTIKMGTTVTWKNVGSAPHTATSEPTAPVKFDSGQIDGSKEFSFKFEQAGEIPYYCKLHASAGARQGMVGTIVVEAA
jgi:plastocyanin